LNIDPNASTATIATSTAAAVPTLVTDPSSAPNGNSQLSNSDSGGGSPFDVVATGAAPQLLITKAGLTTLLASILFATYI
jgi:hypothetical protein